MTVKKCVVTLYLVLLSFLMAIPLSAQDATRRYESDWASLDKRPTPDWYHDAKFGIFIHWGVYSVPSYAPVGKYAEWYWNDLTKGQKSAPTNEKDRATWDFHLKTYGADFPYQQFAPMFRAELFNPDEWADVFARSGAKYVVLTSKHHDGFCLWPSEQADKSWGRPWNSVEVGPKRDLLGDLSEAVRKKNLKMGFYYSLYEWYNPLWLQDKKRYVSEHMHPQFKDVVTRYRPSIIFSDGEWDLPSSEWRSPELLAWLYNESPVRDEVVVDDRWGKDTRHKHGGYYTTEYGSGLPDASHPWEESRGMAYSYGYNRMERVADYRSAQEMILMLVDTVSRGGNLLLDIGPAADGRLPVVMEERLLQMGDWLKVNGEALYGTSPWKVTRQWSAGKQPEIKYGEYMTGYDITKLVNKSGVDAAVIEAFFTRKNRDLYAIIPHWPGRQIILQGLALAKESKVSILGTNQSAKWKNVKDGVVVELGEFPYQSLSPKDALTIKITDVK